jgi:hypothetical protein
MGDELSDQYDAKEAAQRRDDVIRHMANRPPQPKASRPPNPARNQKKADPDRQGRDRGKA